jgi:hypothetical protein
MPPAAENHEVQSSTRTERATGMPRWVKVSLIVAVAVIVLVIILMVTGGHGPGRHA